MLMYKKILLSLLTVSCIVCYQALYAHGDNPVSDDDSEAKRKVEEEQQDRETWDSFMGAVKEQETENNSENKSSNPSSQ